MLTIGPQISQDVRKEMAKEGVKGTKEELNAIYAKRFNEAVSAGRVYARDCRVTDATLGKSATEGSALKARDIARVDYGRTRTDTAARIRTLFNDVRAINPVTFRARLRDVPNPDFAGEPRPNRSHPYSHRPDHLCQRRVREMVHH